MATLIAYVYQTLIIVQESSDSVVEMYYSAAKWLPYSIRYGSSCLPMCIINKQV